MISRTKITAILLGDIALFYAALFLSLLIRYRGEYISAAYSFMYAHVVPFSFVLVAWVLVFYLFDLYREQNFKPDSHTFGVYARALGVNVATAIAIFYFFFPVFGISPKTNLVIFAVLFAGIDYLYRLGLGSVFVRRGMRNAIVFVGDSVEMREAVAFIRENPQVGYAVSRWITNFASSALSGAELQHTLEHAQTLVVQERAIEDAAIVRAIYAALPFGIKVFEFTDLYEILFRRIPLGEINEAWFIRNIWLKRPLYRSVKAIFDRCIAFFLIVLFAPFAAVIALLIAATSAGPIIYRQQRTGLNGVPFSIYKFRSMVHRHNNAPTTAAKDPRITAVGRLIRATHLDELPQLINVIRGDLSFVGPRPESVSLVETYAELPYYEMRHVVRPGITGWAQVNYKASESLAEACEKLTYDIYYIKNQSMVLDLLILIKTIKYLFTTTNT